MPDAKPEITVAIPTYNREEVLVNTIKDVLNQSYENLELLVVDQSKTHSSETEAALTNITDGRFRYYKTTPPSVTAARNFAIAKANSPYIVFLDDDVRLSKDLVKVHLETFREKPELSAVAGRVLQEGFPIKKEVLRFDEFGITHGVFTATEPAYTNAFAGGNCALRIADVRKLGGFETRYRGNAFREENDMSLRMAKAGQLIYFEPKAVLTHLAAPYGGNRVKTHIYDNFGFYKNELFFTARAVALSKLPMALWKKYGEYCRGRGKRTGLRRTIFFCLGFVASLWRMVFGRQVVSKEVGA